jgi:hypothetical protein
MFQRTSENEKWKIEMGERRRPNEREKQQEKKTLTTLRTFGGATISFQIF